jgi:anti-sigma-K factor RskA
MTEHDDLDHEVPDLVGLLTGEVPRREALAVTQHLEGCRSCTRELIDLLMAHAALRSSNRLSQDLATQPVRSSPSEFREVQQPTSEPVGIDPNGQEQLPPLRHPVDSTVQPSGQRDRGPESPRQHPGSWRWVAAAVFAVLVVAGAATVLALHRAPSAPHPTPVASAPLNPITAPSGASGSVAIFAEGSTRSLHVDARDLPEPATQAFYEVWLLDPTTNKMLPMGVLSPSGRGEYGVSTNIMSGYSAVDISLQANDGNPVHSRTSVLRANL